LELLALDLGRHVFQGALPKAGRRRGGMTLAMVEVNS
jgi:hypothetical protein